MRGIRARACSAREVRRRRARRLPRRASFLPGADRLAAANALGRHLALIGFMGAGKSTLGPEIARRVGRAFVDLDRELELALEAPIAQLFAQAGGETAFRVKEAKHTIDVLARAEPAVIALGGGAVQSASVRD